MNLKKLLKDMAVSGLMISEDLKYLTNGIAIIHADRFANKDGVFALNAEQTLFWPEAIAKAIKCTCNYPDRARINGTISLAPEVFKFIWQAILQIKPTLVERTSLAMSGDSAPIYSDYIKNAIGLQRNYLLCLNGGELPEKLYLYNGGENLTMCSHSDAPEAAQWFLMQGKISTASFEKILLLSGLAADKLKGN